MVVFLFSNFQPKNLGGKNILFSQGEFRGAGLSGSLSGHVGGGSVPLGRRKNSTQKNGKISGFLRRRPILQSFRECPIFA